jgi:hypothetical protein
MHIHLCAHIINTTPFYTRMCVYFIYLKILLMFDRVFLLFFEIIVMSHILYYLNTYS